MKYRVFLPFSGSLVTTVEADSEEDAINIAEEEFDKYSDSEIIQQIDFDSMYVISE